MRKILAMTGITIFEWCLCYIIVEKGYHSIAVPFCQTDGFTNNTEVKTMSNVLVDQIYEVLEEVIDPELGVDIVNLGLVYEVQVNEEKQAFIKMTMTSMGCPMAGQIMADAKMKLSMNIKELTDIQIDIVWNPPWGKERMSRYAKIALGIRE